MRTIGITGGVGSGKSALLDYIQDHYNAVIVKSDETAHEVYLPGSSIYEELLDLLTPYPANSEKRETGKAPGEDHSDQISDSRKILLQPDGSLNRKEIAARIFAPGRESLLQQVNDLVHPAVKALIHEKAQQAAGQGADYFFLESALLLESGYRGRLDELWYIYARPEIRRERLRESRGYSDQKIDDIMARQLPEETFRKCCDVVIDNSGSLEKACRQIDEALGRAE